MLNTSLWKIGKTMEEWKVFRQFMTSYFRTYTLQTMAANLLVDQAMSTQTERAFAVCPRELKVHPIHPEFSLGMNDYFDSLNHSDTVAGPSNLAQRPKVLSLKKQRKETTLPMNNPALKKSFLCLQRLNMTSWLSQKTLESVPTGLLKTSTSGARKETRSFPIKSSVLKICLQKRLTKPGNCAIGFIVF